MAVTQIDLINAGLVLIGAKKLSSVRDNTKAARLAAAMWEIVRNEIFDLPINWNFATTRAELSALATAPAFSEYEYQYELPAACVRILAVVDESGDEIEYPSRRELYVDTSTSPPREYDVFLTNQDEVFIKYIYLRTNVAGWPAYFAKLVYINLAILLCEPLRQDKQKKNQLLLMYEEAEMKAKAANASENVDVDDDNVRLEKGNTRVVDAASREEVTTNRILRVE